MKPLFALLACAATALGQNAKLSAEPPRELSDPRAHVFGYAAETITAGVARQVHQYPWNGILIIHWMPAPNGQFNTYQISGIPGYHSQERVEAFLKAFYSKEANPQKDWRAPNVVLCGNNWGAAEQLTPLLLNLSKETGFSVFSVGGWMFTSVKLIEEPSERKAAIERAFAASAPGK